MKYPEVQSEQETVLRLLRTGESLIRIGDGEVKMILGKGNKYEAYDRRTAETLRHVLMTREPGIAIAIPRPIPASPRYEWWKPFKDRLIPYLDEDIEYGSSFITRPDQAPYIAHQEDWFRENLSKLWHGERTMLVGSGASLVPADFANASDFQFFKTTGYNDDALRAQVEDAILLFKPAVVVLCAGMAIKTLVPSLTYQLGARVYDLGSFGKRKHWAIGRAIQEELNARV